MKISIVGLGNMGSVMAKRLIDKGNQVFVYNRTAKKAKPLIKAGAKQVFSPKEAAQKTGIVITVLADDKAVKSVTYGKNGILAGLPKGGIHISSSTITVNLAKELETAHQKHNQAFISANVMGRPYLVTKGQLKVLIAGPKVVIKKTWPILSDLGSDQFVFGEHAYLANVIKLANNFVLYSYTEMVAEALALIQKYQIDEHQYTKALKAFIGSRTLNPYVDLMADKKFSPAGMSLALANKDITNALKAAKEVKSHLPLGEIVYRHFKQGIQDHLGDKDYAIISEIFKKINNQDNN